jgi:hypothetical protein
MQRIFTLHELHEGAAHDVRARQQLAFSNRVDLVQER